MRISTKCSTAVHALLMIAVFSPHMKITSDSIAGSVGRNPVEIRKIFAGLKKAGIIDVARGCGGTVLQRAPGEITLLDIYLAVDTLSFNEWIGIHANSSEYCPIGRNISTLLNESYEQVGDAVRKTMSAVTLGDMVEKLCRMDPDVREAWIPTQWDTDKPAPGEAL
ncbi:Rrf2 family transcriptional regulator [Ruminococcaceae bacterium OttesenSCG-928-L11]|nr:Rrf2 family transcriptional regulator [Ruminococcaceae bacterium OttesenSCG-928-L11]